MSRCGIVVRLEALEAQANRHGQLVNSPELQQAIERAFEIDTEPVALPLAVAEKLEMLLITAWSA